MRPKTKLLNGMVLAVLAYAAFADDAARMNSGMMNPGSRLGFVERIGGGEFKVLVYGNSIALHAPKADIGWTNNWGMAASAPEKDFAHLVVSGHHGYVAYFARWRDAPLRERHVRGLLHERQGGGMERVQLRHKYTCHLALIARSGAKRGRIHAMNMRNILRAAAGRRT